MRLKEILKENKSQKLFDKFKGSYNFQGHMSDEKELELEDLSKVAVDPVLNKPNAFWTSTIFKDAEDFKTKWIEFGRGRHNMKTYLHAFTIVNNPNVLHLGSNSKLEDTLQDYGDLGNTMLKWEDVFEDYDAVHVFDEVLKDERFEHWDIESTVWFRPKSYLKEQFVWKIDGK